ncbi:MAG TPA: CCC motif membrane protein [Bacteroidales bacterium]|nr:CCC motif membrane protein [Bacteroidales bacterium]
MTTTKTTLPNSIAALVLGICSIVFGCFFIGLILGIIGLVLAGKGKKLYNENPELYTGYGMLKAGRITSIIGIILSSVYSVYWLIVVAILGSAGFNAFSLFGW